MPEENNDKQIFSETQKNPVQIKPRVFPKVLWIVVLVLFLVFGILFAKAWNFSSKLFVNESSFFKKITGILFDTGIKGEAQGKIRILMLGYGGEGHDGTYLTDSVILATVNTDDKQILLQSIPRDYYWAAGQQKINFAYASGLAKAAAASSSKDKDHSKGGEAALSAIDQITGLEVPYFISVDFTGFEKAVDALGGLDVTIETSFTDRTYPDNNFGYLPAITFNKGLEHMNGVRALQFARSRHAEGIEGSDFARSKRQAQVVAAFQSKAQKLNLLADSGKINKVLDIVADHAHTNMEPGEVLQLAKLIKNQNYSIVSENVDLENPLFCPKILEEIGYVILPCEGVSTSSVHDYFLNGFKFAGVRKEKAEIILENAGTDTTLYNDVKKSLIAMGVTIYEVTYKGLPLHTSVLYQVNDKPATIKYLEERLGIKAQPKPAQLKAASDLVLIVGGK